MRELMAAVAVLTCWTLVVPPTAGAEPPPAAALVLSVEDVRVIAGNTDLMPSEQLDQPGSQQVDAQYPGECRAVFDQDAAFAGGFSQFRSVSYSGPANRTVTQAVAVYPNSKTAREALTSVGMALKACSELGAPGVAVTTQLLDAKTFALCQAQCSTIYRAAGPVLIAVNAIRFGDSDRIATTIVQQITGRVGE